MYTHIPCSIWNVDSCTLFKNIFFCVIFDEPSINLSNNYSIDLKNRVIKNYIEPKFSNK